MSTYKYQVGPHLNLNPLSDSGRAALSRSDPPSRYHPVYPLRHALGVR